jgi:hypothetical protein
VTDPAEPADEAPADQVVDDAPEPTDDRKGHGAEQRHFPFGPES